MSKGRIAFLSMDSFEGYVYDDDLLVQAVRNRGWDVDEVPWRSAPDWSRWRAVVIRTTWDYQADLPGFLNVLRAIHQSGTPLQNPLALVEWNLRKTYLLDLAAKGIPIIPTVAGERPSAEEIPMLFGRMESSEIVMKPQVGAGAEGIFRLTAEDVRHRAAEVEAHYRDRAYLAQPFLPSILTEGEVSVITFDGEPSHVIRKRPRAGDYRVQEEHGGILDSVPLTPELESLSRRLLAALPVPTLYARLDWVRLPDGGLALMELEAVEPSLYLRYAPGAAERFAAAIDRRWS